MTMIHVHDVTRHAYMDACVSATRAARTRELSLLQSRRSSLPPPAAQTVVFILVRLFTYVHQHRLLSVLCAA